MMGQLLKEIRTPIHFQEIHILKSTHIYNEHNITFQVAN